MTIEDNINILTVLEEGNFEIFKEWFNTNIKKKNYNGSYTYKGREVPNIWWCVNDIYKKNCHERWGYSDFGHQSILASCCNNIEILNFLLENGFVLRESDICQKVDYKKFIPLALITNDLFIENEKLKKLIDKSNIENEKLKKLIDKSNIENEKLKELIDKSNIENEKTILNLYKEINKKNQIIDKYHNNIN
jgi:hypothetical protein